MSGLAPIDKGKRLLADNVFQFLGAAIIDGTLAQGERIRDAELAEKLNVSRMPIREALQRLERIGLVEMMPSRYTRVSVVTDEILQASLAYAGFKSGIEARTAVPLMSMPEREEAASLLDRMTEALGDSAATHAARVAFYRHLSSRVPETLYSVHLHDLELALERNLALLEIPVEQIDALRENYAALREAILRGDADGAERLIREQHGV